MVTAAADGDAGGMPVRPLFWESPEAAKLFGFNYNSGEDVLIGLRERVKMLANVLQSCERYKDVVDHCEQWPLSPKQICHLRNKCLYLRTAYTIALEKMGNDGITWVNTCCQEAVDLLGRLGFITTIDRKRISYWNIHFRKATRFPHPNPYVANGIKSKPPLFEYFPQAAADASSFILRHLDHFSVEMLRNEIITNIIPGLVRESEQDGGGIFEEDSEEHILLSHYTIKLPSYTTVFRWVHYLGFKQDKMKKLYYVDGHEHEDQKSHRSKFTQKYLTQLKPRSHCWVQISMDNAEIIKLSLPAKDPLLVTGHIYVGHWAHLC